MSEPTLTLGDIQLMIAFIDLSASRGNIDGKELTAVGGLRDRLVAFEQHHKEQNESEGE